MIEGVRLMVVGMTTVFAFLGFLVLAMHANQVVANALSPAEPPAPEPPPTNDDAAIAVVLAAVASRREARP